MILFGGPVQLSPEEYTARDLQPSTAGHRNGLPAVRPYTWHRGQAEQEAAIRAQIDAARAAVVSRFRMAGIADDDTCARYLRVNAP